MKFHSLSLPGLVLIKPEIPTDHRGLFVKHYHRELFLKNGIDFVPKEEFYSVSRVGVLRGMHFQVPPADHGKLVHCVRGRVHDVVLDLRKGSPTYGQAWHGQLDDVTCEAIYLPPGLAHGSYSLDPDTIVSYSVSSTHAPGHDRGIRWDGFGHAWPCKDPIISERDKGHPSLAEFETPFTYP